MRFENLQHQLPAPARPNRGLLRGTHGHGLASDRDNETNMPGRRLTTKGIMNLAQQGNFAMRRGNSIAAPKYAANDFDPDVRYIKGNGNCRASRKGTKTSRAPRCPRCMPRGHERLGRGRDVARHFGSKKR